MCHRVSHTLRPPPNLTMLLLVASRTFQFCVPCVWATPPCKCIFTRNLRLSSARSSNSPHLARPLVSVRAGVRADTRKKRGRLRVRCPLGTYPHGRMFRMKEGIGILCPHCKHYACQPGLVRVFMAITKAKQGPSLIGTHTNPSTSKALRFLSSGIPVFCYFRHGEGRNIHVSHLLRALLSYCPNFVAQPSPPPTPP